MRDPNRINKFVSQLEQYWKLVPDWRFGQLIYNFLAFIQNQTDKDFFFIEDEELFKLMEEYFKPMLEK